MKTNWTLMEVADIVSSHCGPIKEAKLAATWSDNQVNADATCVFSMTLTDGRASTVTIVDSLNGREIDSLFIAIEIICDLRSPSCPTANAATAATRPRTTAPG